MNRCIRRNTLHMTLIRLMKTHMRKTHNEFSKIGLTNGQPKILDYLSLNNGCIQRELSENCHIEPATVTSILASMEKNELIIREHNPNDRRILNVFLTEKGFEAQKGVERIFTDIDEECFKGFTPEERETAIKLLERLRENLHGGECKCAD